MGKTKYRTTDTAIKHLRNEAEDCALPPVTSFTVENPLLLIHLIKERDAFKLFIKAFICGKDACSNSICGRGKLLLSKSKNTGVSIRHKSLKAPNRSAERKESICGRHYKDNGLVYYHWRMVNCPTCLSRRWL